MHEETVNKDDDYVRVAMALLDFCEEHRKDDGNNAVLVALLANLAVMADEGGPDLIDAMPGAFDVWIQDIREHKKAKTKAQLRLVGGRD